MGKVEARMVQFREPVNIMVGSYETMDNFEYRVAVHLREIAIARAS